MGYLPVDGSLLTQAGSVYLAATDEATLFSETSGFNNIIRGSMGPSTMPHNQLSTWYQGVRDCTTFLQYVYTCSDPNALQSDKDRPLHTRVPLFPYDARMGPRVPAGRRTH